MSFPPEIYLIGAQKAGTTTLAHLLDQHPNVCVSNPGEIHYLTHERDRGIDWYRSRFPDDGAEVLIDYSTSYAMAPLSEARRADPATDPFQGVPGRVRDLNPDARFMYVLREPVARAYSHHWHRVRTGREDRSFRRAIEPPSGPLEVSNYHGQLSEWLEHFDLDRFHLILFDDLVEEPEKTTRQALSWIGVDESDVRLHLDEPKNVSYVPGRFGRWLNRLYANHGHTVRRLHALRPLIPKVVRNRIGNIRRGTRRPPPIRSEVRSRLRRWFVPRNQRLERLTGMNLYHWRRTG